MTVILILAKKTNAQKKEKKENKRSNL